MNRTRPVRLSGAALLAAAVLSCTAAPPAVATAVRPVEVILVSNGGADVPSGEFAQLVVGCDEDLRAARDQECLDAARAASGSADPAVRAAGEALEYVAGTNMPGAVPDLATEDRVASELDRIPYLTRLRLAELLFRAEMARHAAAGDKAGADRALLKVLETAPPARARAVREERCRAAVGPAVCTGTETVTEVIPTSVPPSTSPTRATDEPPTSTRSEPTGTARRSTATDPPATGDATSAAAPTSSG